MCCNISLVVRARGDNITKKDDDARDDANGVEPSHDDAGKELNP